MVALGEGADLIQERRDQALVWAEVSIGEAARIDQEIGSPGDEEEGAAAAGYLDDTTTFRRVQRKAEEVAQASKELLRGLRLLEPEQRVASVNHVEATPVLAAALLREARQGDLYTMERPAEAPTWAELADRLMHRLVMEGQDDETVRGLYVESLSAKIEMLLAVGVSPLELQEDVDRLASVLPVVLRPFDDPTVAQSAWRAIARCSAHADPRAALEILDGVRRVTDAWSLLERGVEVELFAAEIADLEGDSGLAARHLRQALELAETSGADPTVPRRLIDSRLALATARAGDVATATAFLSELRSGKSTAFPASSLMGREPRLFVLVEAYIGHRKLEAAARELSLPHDRWGYWWATRARLDRLARDLEAGECLTADDQAFHLLDALPRSISKEVREVLEAVVETPNLEQVTGAYKAISFLGESGFGERQQANR